MCGRHALNSFSLPRLRPVVGVFAAANGLALFSKPARGLHGRVVQARVDLLLESSVQVARRKRARSE